MPLPIFKQSLKWAMAITEEKEKEEKKQEQQSKAGDREVVGLDYSFLDWE